VIVGSCAALDVREDAVMACLRRPGRHGREQEARVFPSDDACLRMLRDWLAAEAATRVALDATGAHWRPVWNVLEALEGIELVLVNAHHVRRLPGRKAEVGDACWLAQLLEYELLRGSFVPPCNVARVRHLSRYQMELVEAHALEVRHVRKLLDGTSVQLDAAVPAVRTQPARPVPREPQAAEHVLHDRLDEHDAFVLDVHLAHIDHLTAAIERLDEEVLRLTHPFSGQFAR
jgi:hypothetical protein